MSTRQNRREFLRKSAAAAAAGSAVPYFFWTPKPASAFFQAKNDRPRLGQIGCGGQGRHDTMRALEFGDLLAVCDVDSQHAEKAKAEQGKGKAEACSDYRKLLARSDIDAVIVATPDHWHTKIAIEAMKSGKDVYCEKPLTLTIEEGKQICKVVKETKKVFQVGTQQRSEGPFAKAIALCREGRLGKVHRVTVAIGKGDLGGPFKKESPPSNLNWEMWLGQTKLVDYIKERCHYQFRWWYEYSGGKMTDWGAHHVDIAHWALGAADTGPVSFEGTATHPVPLKNGYPTQDDKYNTAREFKIVAKFADGREIVIRDTHEDFGNGCLIEGDKSSIFVDRGQLTGDPVDALKDHPLPADAITKVYNGKQHGHHMRNFFECLKTREQPISDVFSHHRALSTCHLANICIRLGRSLKWDPAKEQIVGDEEANAWQRREQRVPYQIEA
ncbi:MAG: Gfo/Idh/MocA family oxidoreductase [Planctomycetia bacterium]|nr:Gfo/Idh/MocA family oxidoreductase [Planctomycetia bacterium]